MPKYKPKIKIIPLGGQGEVGRNMLLLQYLKKILIIDLGLRFPEQDMPGVDFIVPDISYLESRTDQILGVIISHGHFDHIGGVPYLIKRLGNPPIYTSKLTRAMIQKRQQDFPDQPQLNINPVQPGDQIKLKPFVIEFFEENHNIPGTLGSFIQTPVGNMLHTADFKFDPDPVFGQPTDFERLKELGSNQIRVMFSDSTRAEEQGHSLSERKIIENLDRIFKNAEGRIVVATFSSLIKRIQEVIHLSQKYNRKVALGGYSMRTNVQIARDLGYIEAPEGTLISLKKAQKMPHSKVTVICTGAQGEPRAVLMRAANREHPHLKFGSQDTVVFSSSVIPGNERAVQLLKDDILRQGAKIIHYELMDIHAGGHAKQQELKKMIEIMDPEYLIPVHGQFSMLVAHAQLAQQMGMPKDHTLVVEDGDQVEVWSDKVSVKKDQVSAETVMIDGLGLRDVEEIVLRDRRNLAEDGIFVIVVVVDRKTGKVQGSPDIISRGFVYLDQSKKLLARARDKAVQIVHHTAGQGQAFNVSYVKKQLGEQIGQFLYNETKRHPMVLPVVVEI